MANRKKDKNKINNTELIKTIAKLTTLSQDQVRLCLDTFFQILEETLTHPNCQPNFEVKFGDIGKLWLSPRKGRRAGIHKRPNGYEKGCEIIETVLEEDEPDYQLLQLKVFGAFKNRLKESSITRMQKQGLRADNGKYIPIDSEGDE